MIPLPTDLETPKLHLADFGTLCKRILDYLPNIISDSATKNDYRILSSVIAGTKKYARPINTSLFVSSSAEFTKQFETFIEILNKLKQRKSIGKEDLRIIDSTVYTIQQSIGVGMDFLLNPNSARKHVGNRFEELIRCIISTTGVTNDKVVFKIPYPSAEGEKMYSCETDIILSPYDTILSSTKMIAADEIIISLKTSSKDRMGKIFLDKMLMHKFADKPVKVIGIFLNDVQRKETDNISYTFVSGLFMVYTNFLTELDGVYFVDPPPITLQTPYDKHISSFSQFIAIDIWTLLAP